MRHVRRPLSKQAFIPLASTFGFPRLERKPIEASLKRITQSAVFIIYLLLKCCKLHFKGLKEECKFFLIL